MNSSGRITRRDLLRKAGETAVAVALYGAISPYVYAGETTRKPNLVYVFPDQMRNCSWAMNDPMVRTPCLSALAAQSTTFNQCISNYPLCCPHRSTLITGKYAQQSGVMRNGMPLPASNLGIGDVFKQAGYATGYVGKWHLYGNSSPFVPAGPNRHGFDWWRACFNYEHVFDTKYYDDNGKPVTLPGYAPHAQMDLALDFITQHAHEPFCIYLSWLPPHPPYTSAPDEYLKSYSGGALPQRANVPGSANTHQLQKRQMEYFGHVSAEDAEIGRLTAKLAELGIADDTILVFTSDHGDMLGSLGRMGKNVPWEESVNVPFIVRYPGVVPAEKRTDALFSSVDICPTLLGLCGIPIPAVFQGRDLSPVLRDQQASGPDSVFIMSEGDAALSHEEHEKGAKDPPWRGVRTKQFTYAKHGERGELRPWLLYDNQADPHQMRNLVGSPQLAKVRDQLEGVLGGYLKQVGEG